MSLPRPMFIDGGAGRLFAVHWPGGGDETIVFLPAFGEEMNRSRRMVTLLARAVAARGVGLLALDPFGTGDSEGDFAQASWRQWLDDAGTGIAWLRARGQRAVPAGLRIGAALALAAARAERTERVVLWQPVLDGAGFLNQFLRIRVAAGLGAEGESVGGLRARLGAGETIEIGGMELVPAMAEALDRLRLEDLAGDWGGQMLWFQVGGVPAPAAALAERWRIGGHAVTQIQVAGPSFWAIEETALAPELVAATAAALAMPRVTA